METAQSQSSVGSSPEVHRLREDMRKLQEDVKGLGSSLSRISELLRERGVARGHEGMEKLSEEVREAYGTVRDRGYRARASIEKEIEERPFTSVAGAFIVGIILGKLVSSRR